METINRELFLFINAPAQPAVLMVTIARWLADYLIWAIPAVVAVGWLTGREQTRRAMLGATMAGLSGLLLNQLIGFAWVHPRPFMIGLGHTLIPHAADSSFPSDHLTLLWAVAFRLLFARGNLRQGGVLLTLIGLPVAWARIYLGVHFPFDMVGAAVVAALCAWACYRCEKSRALEAAYQLATAIHGQLLAPFIRRGWLPR